MSGKIDKLDADLKHLEASKLESVDRRKAVKRIVGGVTAIAAYNMLPVRWESPVIDQIFLPVHAQTSGAYTVENMVVEYIEGNATTETVTVRISGQVNPPVAGQEVILTITP